MEYPELSAALEHRIDSMLSPARAAHSRAVAALAAALCERQGIDPLRGRVAGLAHDLCKELPRKEQRRLAGAYPGSHESSALMADKILHGPAAAFLLARDYGVDDAELLEAIALHTVGKPGLSGLSLILYCADKLEPGRDHVDPAFVERCLALPPSEMLRVVVADTMSWLTKKGHAIAPETKLLYNSLVDPVSSP